jgi:hypothetical protein
MAAGQGFKTFVTGEVLTAGDVNGYLMQGINVFTNATARDAAITAPAEGQFAFTKDNNSLWYYDGAAWVASGATGDIEGVTAGVGISGGGTSGTVTVTNSMATAIDAKGDLVPGTGADTFSRLAVGANDTVLTADSSTATGLKWAAVSGGGMTLISTTTLSGTTVTLSSIPSTYNTLYIIVQGAVFGTLASPLYFLPNNLSTNFGIINRNDNGTAESVAMGNMAIQTRKANQNTGGNNVHVLEINNYANTSYLKAFRYWGYQETAAGPVAAFQVAGSVRTTSAISSFVITTENAYTFSGGQVLLYGVK